MKNENTKPSNPYAFACTTEKEIQEGMTLRDYFANSAMQGMLSNPNWMKENKLEKFLMPNDIVSKVAYEYADAMLKQREL